MSKTDRNLLLQGVTDRFNNPDSLVMFLTDFGVEKQLKGDGHLKLAIKHLEEIEKAALHFERVGWPAQTITW